MTTPTTLTAETRPRMITIDRGAHDARVAALSDEIVTVQPPS
jgi:hypothetical protein